jgi:hypothetical protein
VKAYLPLDAIQAHLQQNPHEIKQETALSEDDIRSLVVQLKAQGLDSLFRPKRKSLPPIGTVCQNLVVVLSFIVLPLP